MKNQELESQRQTAQWFEELKPSVKDMVCNIYAFIVRHENNPNVNVDFSDEGIAIACERRSISRVSEKFVQRVIQNIDLIKALYDKRPYKRVVYWNVNEINDVEVCYFKHVTIYGYDDQKVNDRIYHERTDWKGSRGRVFDNKLELTTK